MQRIGRRAFLKRLMGAGVFGGVLLGSSEVAYLLRQATWQRAERTRLVLTPYGQVPTYLICDHDSKFGSCFARVAATSNIELLRTPYHAKRPNATCERFLGSVRRECLDHLFILNERQIHHALTEYVAYFNRARPHQGIRQQLPEPSTSPVPLHLKGDKVCFIPILGGLHHNYQRVA